jgi:hypothetical protein
VDAGVGLDIASLVADLRRSTTWTHAARLMVLRVCGRVTS